MNAQGGGPGRGMGGMRGRQMMGRYCPMLVRQTTVSVVDASGGAALEFKTSSGDVEDLRARVQHLADMHNHGGCRMMQSMSTDAPGSTASVEDIDGGARLLFRPKDAAQLDALREHARRQAQVFEKGDCPMQ